MGRGKIGAQCGHAALIVTQYAQKRNPTLLEDWMGPSRQDIQLYEVHSEEQLDELDDTAREKKLFSGIVYDAGRTQIEAGSGFPSFFSCYAINYI